MLKIVKLFSESIFWRALNAIIFLSAVLIFGFKDPNILQVLRIEVFALTLFFCMRRYTFTILQFLMSVTAYFCLCITSYLQTEQLPLELWLVVSGGYLLLLIRGFFQRSCEHKFPEISVRNEGIGYLIGTVVFILYAYVQGDASNIYIRTIIAELPLIAVFFISTRKLTSVIGLRPDLGNSIILLIILFCLIYQESRIGVIQKENSEVAYALIAIYLFVLGLLGRFSAILVERFGHMSTGWWPSLYLGLLDEKIFIATISQFLGYLSIESARNIIGISFVLLVYTITDAEFKLAFGFIGIFLSVKIIQGFSSAAADY